jgi:type IV pilus modification protein PilV
MMTATNAGQIMSRHVQRGVTLLENMVALLVISVGLLGFAGMQAFTLHGGASTTYRQLAMQQAQDMADRIRANPAAYYTLDAVTGLYPNRYHGVKASAAPTAPPTDCRTKSCTASEFAAFDIYEWQTANNALLPGDHKAAGGYIVAENLTPLSSDPGMPARQRFTIAVRWDGDNTGSTSVGTLPVTPTDCAAVKATDLRCYAVVIDL